MKVHTKAELVEVLDEGLAWRRKELTSLNFNVHRATAKVAPTAIRSAVVMLYAHWEGYIKYAAEAYLSYVQYQKLRLDEVSYGILSISLKQKLNTFSSTNKSTLYVQFIQYFKNNLNEDAKFSISDAINTRSNLNSEVLKEIFTIIGVDISHYELKSNLIDAKLLNYRNTIAHGNQLTVTIADYSSLHNEIMAMLDNIRTDISNSILVENYKAPILV